MPSCRAFLRHFKVLSATLAQETVAVRESALTVWPPDLSLGFVFH
jgi:hypothetical protein